MAKELPYFRFFVGKWIAGDITMCSMAAQGLFINICAYYWNKHCSICLANAKQRFSNNISELEQLIFQEIILVDEDENIIIKFLDDQMNEFENVSEKRAVAGSKGGKANAKQMLSKSKAKSSNIDKSRVDKSRVDNIYIPSFDEFKNYALENDPNVNLIALELKYKAWKEDGWKDGKGRKIKNWKSKILHNLQYIEHENNKRTHAGLHKNGNRPGNKDHYETDWNK